MKINNREVIGDKFAYDGCHKIYIIEDESDRKKAEKWSYEIVDISEIKEVYESSCELRFIYNWKLDRIYVRQFENAVFEGNNNMIEM